MQIQARAKSINSALCRRAFTWLAKRKHSTASSRNSMEIPMTRTNLLKTTGAEHSPTVANFGPSIVKRPHKEIFHR